VLDDPYDFEQCQVTAAITWLPADGDPRGRPVLAGVRTHLDAPILRVYREANLPLAALPAILESLLAELRQQLPERQADRRKREAEAQRKPKAAARKAAPAAPHPEKKPEGPSQAAAHPTAAPAGRPPTQAQLSLFDTLINGGG
jgi:hypothetical protein